MTLIAKKIIVHTVEINDHDPTEEPSNSSFEAWEFPNGVILVEGLDTSDWFFRNRGEIQACGNAIVVETEETEETANWTKQELVKSVSGSIREFSLLSTRNTKPTRNQNIRVFPRN